MMQAQIQAWHRPGSCEKQKVFRAARPMGVAPKVSSCGSQGRRRTVAQLSRPLKPAVAALAANDVSFLASSFPEESATP